MAAIFLTIFVSLCISFNISEAAQSFSESPTHVWIKPGQEGVLTCRVKDKAGMCSWKMEGKPVTVSPGKLDWAGDQTTGDCSLKILNAEANSHEGYWSCHVSSSGPSASDSIETAPVYLSVGENCQIGKPCSKTDGNDNIGKKPHHRPKGSSYADRNKGSIHPFGAMFSYNYWKPRSRPLTVRTRSRSRLRIGQSLKESRDHDLFDGLRRVHYYHDHDFFTSN